MEEKAVLRVRDRISAALTVPYVRRAVWLMAGGLAGFLTARGLVFGKYAPFAAAGAAAAPFSTMWAVILGGAFVSLRRVRPRRADGRRVLATR